MTRTASASSAGVRNELLARIGLKPTAHDEAIELTHDQIVDYLAAAPAPIKGWADRRQSEVDRVFELLTGPESELAALAAPTVDAAALADLMKKVAADPKDNDSLQKIADLYYNAGDFKNAGVFLDKVLANDPANVKALIAAGAAAYNAGDNTTAEARWGKAATIEPNNAEIHYDMGFLYMTTKRTDLMQAEWAKVVQLAPGSQMAQNVQQHVGSATAAPSAAPTK